MFAAGDLRRSIRADMRDREDDVMKQATVNERAHAPIVDYSAARDRAIKWLGDRYLLAKPINADGRRARFVSFPSRTPR